MLLLIFNPREEFPTEIKNYELRVRYSLCAVSGWQRVVQQNGNCIIIIFLYPWVYSSHYYYYYYYY